MPPSVPSMFRSSRTILESSCAWTTTGLGRIPDGHARGAVRNNLPWGAVDYPLPPSSGLISQGEHWEPYPVAATRSQGIARGAKWLTILPVRRDPEVQRTL